MVYVHVRRNEKDDETEPIQPNQIVEMLKYRQVGRSSQELWRKRDQRCNIPQMALEVRRDTLKKLLGKDARYLDAGDPEKKRLMPKTARSMRDGTEICAAPGYREPLWGAALP
jgi:hypothetical protein